MEKAQWCSESEAERLLVSSTLDKVVRNYIHQGNFVTALHTVSSQTAKTGQWKDYIGVESTVSHKPNVEGTHRGMPSICNSTYEVLPVDRTSPVIQSSKQRLRGEQDLLSQRN